jgi:hypothetical protein
MNEPIAEMPDEVWLPRVPPNAEVAFHGNNMATTVK